MPAQNQFHLTNIINTDSAQINIQSIRTRAIYLPWHPLATAKYWPPYQWSSLLRVQVMEPTICTGTTIIYRGVITSLPSTPSTLTPTPSPPLHRHRHVQLSSRSVVVKLFLRNRIRMSTTMMTIPKAFEESSSKARNTKNSSNIVWSSKCSTNFVQRISRKCSPCGACRIYPPS